MLSMRTLVKCAALAATLSLSSDSNSVAARAPVIVADEQPFVLAVNASERIASQTLIPARGATFLTVHFAEFNLAAGDKVVVRDVLGRTKYEYTGLGRGELGKRGGFFSSRLPGDQAVVEFIPATTTPSSADFGFKIDKIARSSTSASPSTVCGTDDSRPAKCFVGDAGLPLAYDKAKAVARLMINGTEACTGWLVGSEGHLLTNEHCIGTKEEAAVTDFEFDAESSACSEECQLWEGCPGKIVATSATLLAVNAEYDYALVKLNTTADLSEYGHLTLRVAGAVQNEQIYVPQHPSAWAKRIAAVDDSGNVTRVNHVGVPIACGAYSVGYTSDTRGGSSGSPVIAASDNRVVALHNCGGLAAVCENGGIDVRTLLWDLKSKGVVLPASALSDPAAEVPSGPWIPGTTKAPTPAPTPVPTASVCKVFRQQSTCENTVPGKKCIWQNGLCVPNPALTPPTATPAPTTAAPTPAPTTATPTPEPTTIAPTPEPTTITPTPAPTTATPTPEPTSVAPTPAPTTATPTPEPTTVAPTPEPTTAAPVSSTPTVSPSPAPTTLAPSPAPTYQTSTVPTVAPTSKPTKAPKPTKTPKPTKAPKPTPAPTPTPAIPPQCKNWPKVVISLCIKFFQ